jgi:hypothetical protein
VSIKVDEAWRNWEQRFLDEEEQAYREAAENQAVPQRDLMTSVEVCEALQWSTSTLRRNTKARKLAFIKRDGRVWFKREDVARYDKRRYIPAK